MKYPVCVVALFFLMQSAFGQELFPTTEPASNVPKGAAGIRLFGEGYPEGGLVSIIGLRLMSGPTPRLSVYATVTVSDYHEKTLPFDFITHDHSGTKVSGGANTPQTGVLYPYVFNSADFYAKYRFISVDGENTHFRMAIYGEGSYVAVPSHEAEPDLLIHTSGYGAGLIGTYLFHHFAVSLTTGFIIPSDYRGDALDKYGGIYPTTIVYGRAVNYDLSFGYLLFPKNYKDYQQANWNVYCEFIGKSYGAANVTQLDGPPSSILPNPEVIKVSNTTPILRAGNYVDVNPGLQCIMNSTYRIEVSVELPLINRSYDHLYPLLQLGMQRYFFPARKKNTKKSD